MSSSSGKRRPSPPRRGDDPRRLVHDTCSTRRTRGRAGARHKLSTRAAVMSGDFLLARASIGSRS